VQRKREIGILRALGLTRSGVTRLLTLEGFLLSLVGSSLGVLLGLVLARLMLATVSRSVDELYQQVSATELRFDAPLLLGGFVLGVVAATLASALPARMAARPSPIETLRTSALMSVAPPTRKLTRYDGVALALLVPAFWLLRFPPVGDIPLGAMAGAACLMLAGALLMPRLVQLVHGALQPLARRWFGLEAELANDNLPRDLARTATTAGALMVGVSMAMSFAVFTGSLTTSMLEWIDRSIPADLFVTSAARFSGVKNVPMASSLGDELAKVPGVEIVERLRNIELDYRNVPVRLLSTDTSVYDERVQLIMLEGSHDEARQKLGEGAVVISENFARRFDLHRGDHVELAVKDGTRAFEVAGVDIDYTSDQGMLLMDRKFYVEHWGDEQVDTFKLYLAKGASAAALENARSTINRRHGERFDLFVLTNREFKTEVVGLLDQVFAVMRVLELVALIIAVLGVVNALFASVIDRLREIGVLRAVGMLRRQARKMIVVEGLLIGLCGVIGGTLVGSATGWVLLAHINVVQTGWFFPYRPAWLSVLETALLAIAVSGVAASYPARRAAALVIADALDYE